MAETVRVICRARPLNSRETKLGCKSVLKFDSDVQIAILNPSDDKVPPKTFTFDGVYGIGSTTEQIYADVGFPLVESVMEGYNGTVFAYGQTGCGKSFTMQGINDPPTQRGIIPRSFEHIFEAINVAESTKFLVQASYCEIYNEEIRDLLGKNSKAKLDLKEHPEKGVYVQGLTLHAVNSVAECKVLMEKGWSQRAVGETLMNADSSRSHSIFTIHVEMCDQDEGEDKFKAAKLNLVDLAGSERQAKTGATGERLKEATKINLSLSALGNVISALVDGKAKHIPYRDSKLTRLLQDSLGGNTKTLMVAALSPADNNYDETLSTLRYANRAKNIKNKPKINEDPKDALLREYQEEIKRLKSMLATSGVVGASPSLPAPPPPPKVVTQTKVVEKVVTVENKEAIEREKQLLREEYELKLTELRQEFEAERSSKAQLQREVEKIQGAYEEKMSDFIREEAKNQEQIQKAKAADRIDELRNELSQTQTQSMPKPSLAASESNLASTTTAVTPTTISQSSPIDKLDSQTEDCIKDEDKAKAESPNENYIVTPDSFATLNNGSSAPAPTSSPEPLANGTPVAAPNNLIQAEAALQRLQELQLKLVGGELKGDDEIKENRKKKMSHATKRKLKLMQAIEKMEDDGILIKTYENIHEELRAKTNKLRVKTEEVEKLEVEISDLQAEFEFDRIDYLATIRQQDKQIKLMSALLERLGPTVRRDCNYSNLDRVKGEAVWNEEEGEWTIPDLKVEKTSLPSTERVNGVASVMPGGRPLGPFPPASSSRGSINAAQQVQQIDAEANLQEDRYLQRLQQRQNGDEAADYFKNKRAEQLLGDMRSTMQNGSRGVAGPFLGTGSFGLGPEASPGFHHGVVKSASPDVAPPTITARPGMKLEALPPRSAKKKKGRKPNSLEPL